MIKHLLATALLLMALASCSGAEKTAAANSNDDAIANDTISTPTDMQQPYNPADSGSVKVQVETTVGSFTVLLYGDTPRHRDNFLRLVKEGTYNGTLFHRVIDKFMVQAGDPESKGAPAGKMLGSGDMGYTIEAEFRYPTHFHKRGALAAARQGDQVNPERRSSGSQFYVVTGDVVPAQQLTQLERQMGQMQMQDYFNGLVQENAEKIQNLRAARDTAGMRALQQELVDQTEAWGRANKFTLPAQVREAYSTVGGTPHLDGQYTVFGEVISGMDTIDKIEKAETDRNDRPKEDIKIISMKVVE